MPNTHQATHTPDYFDAACATAVDTDGNPLIVGRWYALWNDEMSMYAAMLGEWTGEGFVDEDEAEFGLYDNMAPQPGSARATGGAV